MTICVAARVNDCIVFAADSATTLVDQRGNQILNVYDYGNKVFNLYKGLPVCAMTCGFGNIGRQSISTIAKDLRRRLVSGGPDWAIDRKNYNISDIAEKARKYIFEERYQSWANKPQGPHSLNFYLGGYSSQAEGHELWQITIENGACPNAAQISKDGECGLNWAGQPEPINRLVFGLSPQLQAALVNAGLPTQDVNTLLTGLQSQLEVNLVNDAMPVQDAIDLARFLVDTTKSFYRFLPGANIVGGETDIAVVTRHEGFKWICRKHHYPASLNLMETDHE